jgi:hypothetical protein
LRIPIFSNLVLMTMVTVLWSHPCVQEPPLHSTGVKMSASYQSCSVSTGLWAHHRMGWFRHWESIAMNKTKHRALWHSWFAVVLRLFVD